jgi:uncharacterized protein YndB with AHSA1/START domain
MGGMTRNHTNPNNPTKMTTATKAVRPVEGIAPHIVTRTFDAPRDRVWDVCTQAEHLAKWFAPEGRTGYIKSMDFRPGGKLHYGNMENGTVTVWGIATYLEIDPKDRIVFVQSFSDEQGGIGSHPMAPGWPQVMHCMYRFDDLGGNRTRLTVEWTPAEGTPADSLAMFDAARSGMDQGWKGTLDKLESYINTVK